MGKEVAAVPSRRWDMPTVTFQFDTFSSEGTGVAWSNPGNAVSEGSGSATVALTSGNSTSQLLVCTGADLSSEFPAGTVIQSVKVRINARIDPATEGGATIDRIWAWDGSVIQGRNMAGYPLSVEGTEHNVLENDPIDLDTTLTYYPRGVADWLWWRINRLEDSANGIAIQVIHDEGSPTVEIDHVELEITYVQLFQKTPVVDYRVITYQRVAGHSLSNATNEGGELYRPGGSSGIAWDTDPEAYLDDVIERRTRDVPSAMMFGVKRLVLGTPAGDLTGMGDPLVAGAQWEPMWDEQRAALTKVIPNWLKKDPEHEAILYVGSRIDDPSRISMSGPGVHFPDVLNEADVAKLERTFFPYRDFVGIKRFFMDNSSPIADRVKARALFAWARDNGMEFVIEAIPHDEPDPHTGSPDPLSLDETITEVYSAYALSRFIIGGDGGVAGHDDTHLWDFTKGRLAVQVRSGDHDETGSFATPSDTLAFFKGFAREGYGLIPSDFDGGIDEPARLVAEEHIGRGVASSVSSTASHAATNSVTRFVEGQRTSGNGR